MTLPLDIWRHMLSFRDHELDYRISILSKQLHSLAKPYRQAKVTTARKIPSYIATPPINPCYIWDECITNAPWVKVHPNRKNKPMVFLTSRFWPSSSQVLSRSISKDKRYTCELVCHNDGFILTVRSYIDELLRINTFGFFNDEAYDYYDQQYIFVANGVTLIDRYHVVIFTDKTNRDFYDRSELSECITRFLSQQQHCEYHWYSEERELHLVFALTAIHRSNN